MFFVWNKLVEETPEEIGKQVREWFNSLTFEEKLQTFIDAGILIEDRKLTKRYGGDGDEPAK